MNDDMNPLAQFSPYAGVLTQETVLGETSEKVEFENDIQAQAGRDRTMYCYAPASGCPDSKQTQVLMALRDGSDKASAEMMMKKLGLDRLAEEQHFLLLFPNPDEDGWNYRNDPARDNDMDYLVRCFGNLRNSKIGVNGFNGMVFYLAASESSSAMLMTMAALRPMNVPAMMISKLPEDYEFPADARNVEVAAWCRDLRAAEYLKMANGASVLEQESEEVEAWRGKNREVRLFFAEQEFNEENVRMAWDRLFSVTRRWQNDTFGTYQHRTAFAKRGFVAHVNDSGLGVNNSFPHTWYEYIPPKLRGSAEKVPLVFYFHGVNCVPLYGAEQSNWHDIADRENFIVVYPAPAKNKAWNIFDVPALPSDMDFVLALIGHMKEVHPIDESRIYLSGFSMGAMMTHALAGAYPELFAAAAPCNAFHVAHYKDPAETLAAFMSGTDRETIGHISRSKLMSDEKKAARDYRMPLFQNAGYDDVLIGTWPVGQATDDARLDTIQWWKAYNNIPVWPCLDANTLSGLKADESFYEDDGQRFLHQRWHSKDAGAPSYLELVLAKRMPHAVNPVQLEWAWDFMRKFARGKDGSLIIIE